jgi:hypothetical protein
LKKAAFGFIGGKFQFERLTPQPYRHGKEVRFNGLVADIDNPMPDLVWGAGKKHAFQAPEREKNQFLIFRRSIRQHVAKITVGLKIRVYATVFAAEQPICFFQDCGGAALGALMFDEKVDDLPPLF